MRPCVSLAVAAWGVVGSPQGAYRGVPIDSGTVNALDHAGGGSDYVTPITPHLDKRTCATSTIDPYGLVWR